MCYYVLLDKPNNYQRNNIEWLSNNPTIIAYFDKYQNLAHAPISELNQRLLAVLRHYRPDYLPISGHEYLPISKEHPEINEQIGLHKLIYQKVIFDHQPVYFGKAPESLLH